MILYGYVDYTLESIPRPFYVGIGNITRVKSKRRNRQHAEIAERLGVKRVIEFECSSEAVVEAWEIGTTAAYHTYVGDPSYNGVGCNLVRGGHRNSGRIDSPEVKQKRGRAVSKARQGKPLSEAQRQSLTRLNISHRGLSRSDEVKQRISMSHKGKPKSEAHKQKLRKPKTEEHKRHLSESLVGKNVVRTHQNTVQKLA